MKITSVEYSRLANLGNYENEKVGAVATIDEGADPVEALTELRAWVEGQLAPQRTLHDVRAELHQLRCEKADAAYEVEQLKGRVERMREFLKAHGVDLQEELPF